MSKFQRYGFPFQYYRPYNYYMPHTPVFKSSPIEPPVTISVSPKEEKPSKSDSNVWLDIFGIKLYFDDVLILSLLFFLYKEEVKDEGLFLALVLLLIS